MVGGLLFGAGIGILCTTLYFRSVFNKAIRNAKINSVLYRDCVVYYIKNCEEIVDKPRYDDILHNLDKIISRK